MRAAKKTLLAIVALGCVSCVDSAMAQGMDVGLGIGIPLAPGQAGTSPGQVFNSARITNPNALPPGQLYNQNKAGGASPPGHTFTNPGRHR